MSSQHSLVVSCFRGLTLVPDPSHGLDMVRLEWTDQAQQWIYLLLPLSEALVLRDALLTFDVSKYVPQ